MRNRREKEDKKRTRERERVDDRCYLVHSTLESQISLSKCEMNFCFENIYVLLIRGQDRVIFRRTSNGQHLVRFSMVPYFNRLRHNIRVYFARNPVRKLKKYRMKILLWKKLYEYFLSPCTGVLVNARSDNNVTSCKRTCPLRLSRGKENVDMIKEFLLDQSSILGLPGIFDSRWCTSSQVCSSTQKIHPPEVSAHISNRLFVLENTRRFREASRKYVYTIRCDSLVQFAIELFVFFSHDRFFQACSVLFAIYILLFYR